MIEPEPAVPTSIFFSPESYFRLVPPGPGFPSGAQWPYVDADAKAF